MSHEHQITSPINYLLLRDGHVVPIFGLSPDHLKQSKRKTLKRDGIPLKSTSCHNAIVDSLGFKGDFGDYKNTHWPRLQQLMAKHGLEEYRNLFEVALNDLGFSLMEHQRRALADRIFLGPQPTPRRVFTGYGHDWAAWDKLFNEVLFRPRLSSEFNLFNPTDLEEARRWVYCNRMMFNNRAFFSDHLLDLGKAGDFEAKTYFTNQVSDNERERTLWQEQKVAEVFRWFIDQQEDGWLQIIPVTSNLVFLKGPEGTYDLLWRNLRTALPPTQDEAGPYGLHLMDVPSFLQSGLDFSAWYYFQRDRWEEKEVHEAERHYYANGGRGLPEYPGVDAVLEQLLRSRGQYAPTTQPHGLLDRDLPGFKQVALADGRLLWVSKMITVEEFLRFVEATDYLVRRDGEDWSAANEGNKALDPVGATFRDALAYCAWKEQEQGLSLRLLTLDEHRLLRPIASDYARIAGFDFPWEHRPPHAGLETAVQWSEPRFKEPDATSTESDSLFTRPSLKQYHKTWPPKAIWRHPLPWIEHTGVEFVDAWDAYEWCYDGRVAGRYWHGHMGGTTSWGEYKNVKIGFRLVLATE